MAISNQIDCNPVVGCVSTKSVPEMTAQCHTSPSSRPNTTKGIGAIIRSILDAVISSYKRHQSRADLNRLSDDQLRDIGLEREHDGHIIQSRF
ncbi:DUF1127 domain-containing protein [Thalassospira profundimaris]|uniref:YjiS-like domain-containing protein n=1 Tax=Thalassospira profundimaris TaxID=502049 RepID=A0A367WR14_9PROT|nr:DUF1127 domain-containing protein [Thalassospira profundimaris]RCK43818.1 hypothetical protein TH30_17725 [Thalassospira profundimaris]